MNKRKDLKKEQRKEAKKPLPKKLMINQHNKKEVLKELVYVWFGDVQ